MNLKQLEVFVAVADSGSFSRGAELSFITQSTVSQHIAALEREFDVRLLDRTGKGVFPTEGGKVLLNRARRLLAEEREVRQAMDRFHGMEDIHLRVGGSNIPGSYLVPAALPLVVSRFPGIRITMLQGDSREILQKVAREEVEIGVVGSSFDEADFSFTPLGRDEIRLIVCRQHKWVGREGVAIEELAKEPFILREPGSGTGKTVQEALQRAGIDQQTLNVRAWLGSNEAVKHAVAGGIGISFLSLVSVRKEIEQGEMAALAVQGLEITRQFYLASRTGRQLSPAAAAFAGVMAEISRS